MTFPLCACGNPAEVIRRTGGQVTLWHSHADERFAHQVGHDFPDETRAAAVWAITYARQGAVERESDVAPFDFAASFTETANRFHELPMCKQVDYLRSQGAVEPRSGPLAGAGAANEVGDTGTAEAVSETITERT